MYKPRHDKTSKPAWARSEVWDQPGHPQCPFEETINEPLAQKDESGDSNPAELIIAVRSLLVWSCLVLIIHLLLCMLGNMMFYILIKN